MFILLNLKCIIFWKNNIDRMAAEFVSWIIESHFFVYQIHEFVSNSSVTQKYLIVSNSSNKCLPNLDGS